MTTRVSHNVRQQGVALITALLILAITATAAAFMVQQEQLEIRRSGNIINSNKSYLYALGAEKLAMIGLTEDFNNDPAIDEPEEIWAAPQAFDVEDNAGYVAGKISDMQGKFNVNNLVTDDGKIDPVWANRFNAMLSYFEMNNEYSGALIDWIDPDNALPTGPGGAEDDYYLGLDPPYHAANRKIVSLSELKLIRGLGTHKNLPELMKHLAALPMRTPVNVNMMTPQVQAAIENTSLANYIYNVEGGDQEDIQAEINQQNKEKGQEQKQKARRPVYNSVDDYMGSNNLVEGENSFSRQDLSTTTSFFLLEVEAKVDQGRIMLKSVLHRDDKGKMRVVMRSQGSL